MTKVTGFKLAAAFAAALSVAGCAGPQQTYTEDNFGNARVTPAQNVPITCGGTIVDRGARTGNTITYDPNRSDVVRKCNFGNAARSNESSSIINQEIQRTQRDITRDAGREVRGAVRNIVRDALGSGPINTIP